MNLKSEYTVEYFINKFEAIPEDQWTTEVYEDDLGRQCAFGHCSTSTNPDKIGFVGTTEAADLLILFIRADLSVACVNDGRDDRFQQPTPKQRILTALRHISNAS